MPGAGPTTIWIGGAGTGTALGLMLSAREAAGDEVRLVAADMHPAHLVAASAVADAFEQVPPTADASFPARLEEGLRRHDADLYVPILDTEIELAARAPVAGVTTLAPPHEAALLCLDKLAMARWLEARGLPTPPTAPAGEAAWREGGLVVKPRRGWGSAGVRRLAAAADLEALRGDAELVAQPVCSGPEITIDGFRSRTDGRVATACRERIEVKAGVCTKARVHHDGRLDELARAVAGGLGLTGAFCLQVMQLDGEPHITDVNPRPGAGTRLSAAVGFDPMAALVAEALGRDPREHLGRVAQERHVVRRYVEVVLR